MPQAQMKAQGLVDLEHHRVKSVSFGRSADGARRDSATPAASETAAPALSPDATVWRLIALGDFEITGHGDPSGKGWVPFYADLVAAGSGRDVIVDNRGPDSLASLGLRAALESNADLRDAMAKADIVILGIGGADVNADDDARASGPCETTACYDPVTSTFAYVPRGFKKATCDAMTAHDGACIDVLTAINGPDGEADGCKAGLLNFEECCYPNEKGHRLMGHRLMAELLYATGLAPLEGPTARR